MAAGSSPTFLRSSAEIARLAAALERDGWCHIEGVIGANDLGTVAETIVRETERQAEAWATTGTGRRGSAKAAGVVAALGPRSRFLVDERLIGVVRRVLGAYVRVSSDFGIVTSPGNERGGWHADWPYNQTMAAHVPQPYDGRPLHLSTLFMVTEFSAENGGTLIVPGSHRRPDNPTGPNGFDPFSAHPDEQPVTGPAGSAFLYDARLWHAVAENRSGAPRIALAARYAPWWLNLEVRRRGSVEHRLVGELMEGRESFVTPLAPDEFAALPREVQPLYEHWAT